MSDRSDWRGEAVTQQLMKKLREDKGHIESLWSDGVFTGTTADETLQMNSKNIGMVQAIQDILDWIEEEQEGDPNEAGDLRTPDTD